MAVRFQSSAQTYSTNLGFGQTQDLSITGWFKISQDRNTWSTFWGVDNGNTEATMQTQQNGTTLSLTFRTASNWPALTVGTWYFIGFSTIGSQGLNHTIKVRAEGAGSFTTIAPQAFSLPANTLRIGESIFGNEWLNGCAAAVKVWSANLSDAELEAEYQYRQPLRTSNLFAFYQFDGPSTIDNSGNGRNLSGGTGATMEAGPSGLIDLPGTVTPFQGWGVPIR